MAQLCLKSYNLLYLTRFLMNSNVSDLLNCIVDETAFMLLLDRVHGVLLDLDTPQ